MNTNKTITFTSLTALVLALVACGPESTSDSAQAVASPVANATSSLLLENPPATPPGLLEALADAGPGQPFIFTGRVGGVPEPMTAGFAAFVVADESLEFCDEGEVDDNCPTPWDACCEDPEKIAAARAFVQFVDADGRPLAVDLRETLKLTENSQVVVRGSLAPESAPGNTVIVAEAIAIRR